MQQTAYGLVVETPKSYEETLGIVREALKEQGFGVITEIDVKQTVKEKLGIDFGRYIILGACNPQLAHQALQADIEIGLLLPCNVVVREKDGGSVVSALDPRTMAEVSRNPKIAEIASVAREKLEQALARIKSAAS